MSCLKKILGTLGSQALHLVTPLGGPVLFICYVRSSFLVDEISRFIAGKRLQCQLIILVAKSSDLALVAYILTFEDPPSLDC